MAFRRHLSIPGVKTSTPGSNPALLRCSSTPIAPAFFNPEELLEGEGHLVFGGNNSVQSTPNKRDAKEQHRPRKLRRSPRGRKSGREYDVDESGSSTRDSGLGDSAVGDSSSDATKSVSELSSEIHGAIPKVRRQRDLCTYSSSGNVSDTQLSCCCSVYHFSPGSFEGREQVDVVRHLLEMNVDHVLDFILRHLDGEELCAVALVSKEWNSVLARNKNATKRKREHLAKKKVNMENLEAFGRSYFSSPRKAMGDKSNILPAASQDRESNQKVFVSPSKIRYKLFTDEASKLGPGEQLQICPRCTSPSRVIPSENVATCTRRSCTFEFCTQCRCDAHRGKDCRTSKGSNGSSRLASKRSKNRLKRL